MLTTPVDCPIPNARGFSTPEGSGANGVLFLGEALGDSEAHDGLPFRMWAPAGSVLERAIRQAGFTREQFLLWNVVPVQPPKNYLEGAPYEAAAIAWGLPLLRDVIDRYKPRVILALGNVALKATTGMTGEKRSVSHLAGYLLPSQVGPPVVPFFHPSYLRRGKMGHLGALIRTIKLAVEWARTGRQAIVAPVDDPPVGYLQRPSEQAAWTFLEGAREAQLVASDIETPTSKDISEEETDELDESEIISIQFSIAPGTGIYMPWREPYITVAKEVLALPNPKVWWNGWLFDAIPLEIQGAKINGVVHDGRWAWHHLQPDLPTGLQFAASMFGWLWPWKHISDSAPEFYGIVDVDVLQHIFPKIVGDLMGRLGSGA